MAAGPLAGLQSVPSGLSSARQPGPSSQSPSDHVIPLLRTLRRPISPRVKARDHPRASKARHLPLFRTCHPSHAALPEEPRHAPAAGLGPGCSLCLECSFWESPGSRYHILQQSPLWHPSTTAPCPPVLAHPRLCILLHFSTLYPTDCICLTALLIEQTQGSTVLPVLFTTVAKKNNIQHIADTQQCLSNE